MTVVPIVLCGGSGTRLWPLSRRDFAKHHIPVLGGESPFQRTLRRLAAVDRFDKPIVITSRGGRFLAAEQAAEVGIEIELVLEPMARDTLAAVTLGALMAARRGPDAIAFVMPADHMIPDVGAFSSAVANAVEVAAAGDLVVLGLKPTAPASGYGYIRPDGAGAAGGRRVASFVEKPSADRAADLIAEGCLWNAGIFVFRAEMGLAEIRRVRSGRDPSSAPRRWPRRSWTSGRCSWVRALAASPR